jgi:Fur family transcriptional regulator, ferric uptake regulator
MTIILNKARVRSGVTRSREAVEIASDAVEMWVSRTARRHGYTSVTHTVEVYGLRRECS